MGVNTLLSRMQTPLILMDSIALVSQAQADAIIVSGSHGGLSAAHFVTALQQKPKAVFYNDAGGGKDDAGKIALSILQSAGVIAATYSHDSARIGEAQDAWSHGIVSALNELALAHGLQLAMSVQQAVSHLSTFKENS